MKNAKLTQSVALSPSVFLRQSAIAIAVAAACATSAYAANAAAPADEGLSEIVVTGSRIARRDYEANSPIMTVDDSLLKNSGTAAIETNLAKLPQFHAV